MNKRENRHLVVNPNDGKLYSSADSTDAKVLYKLLIHSYPLDRLPEWGSSKLWAMADVESMRRKAAMALGTAAPGSPERGRILNELQKHQATFFLHEKTVLAALKGGASQTAKEMRDERALAALEGGALGNKMRNLHNAGKDNV